jgi:molybdate transport system substrate-binding protein
VGMYFAAASQSSFLVAQQEAEPTIQVFAAASTTNAIRKIKQQFRDATHTEVLANFGSSAALARQIANGADADVFISADTKWADDLAKRGLVAETQVLLGNRLVLVIPSDSQNAVTKPNDLLADNIRHIAMGDVRSVPAGMYAKKALEKLGLWDRVKSKVATADDVRNALTYVETGAAEVGIVYATDAAITKKVKVVFEVPESLTGPVRYPIVLLKREGGNAAAAKLFYDFLASPNAIKVFESFGFSMVDKQYPPKE